MPEDLLNIEVLQTMVGGTITYCDPALSDEFCDPLTVFRVDFVSIRASNYLNDQTPDRAFDKNIETNWGAGDDAPQWIEFDLGKE